MRKRMLVGKPDRGRRHMWKYAVAMAVLAVLALAAAAESGSQEQAWFPIAPAEEELLGVEEYGEKVFLVTKTPEGVNIYTLNAWAPQANPEPFAWNHSPEVIGIGGGSLRFLCLDSGIPVAYTFREGESGDTVTEKSIPYFVEVEEGSLLAESPEGDILYVAPPFGTLQIAEAMGDQLTAVLDSQGREFEEVEFLCTSREGRFHMYAGGVLYRWKDSLQRDLETYEIAGIERLVGEEYCVDGAGTLCRVEEEGVQPVLKGEDLDFALCCQQGEGFLVADIGGVVHLYTGEGEKEGETGPLDGRIVGLTSRGAVVRREESYCFAPYNFTEEDPEPSQPPEETPGPTEEPDISPSPTPGEEPAPSTDPEEVGVEYQGAYITMKAGTTVEQLIHLFRPDQALIRDAKGEVVTSGRMATDMKVNDYTVVVYGDCSGSGYLSPVDLYMLQAALVNKASFSSQAKGLAADISRDGFLSTLDLVAFVSAWAEQ